MTTDPPGLTEPMNVTVLSAAIARPVDAAGGAPRVVSSGSVTPSPVPAALLARSFT
ncbi:MAG TPA: hypothetical protein VGX51_11050 [Solirubrobacteraceae bacterium]|nr:hypothetical protein [Solirubrobacteraceae bacterium]